ncbi:MAG: hypothetical protein K8R48_05740 [Alphaproteobacteria bacterium]|nr:hypothetical protein [Alphaproteobacteria bacterium]
MTEYTQLDDYTLLATQNLPTGGTLSRYFNFAAGQIVTLFTQRSEMKDSAEKSTYSSEGGVAVSVAVSTALTSQMQIQNFSSLDSTVELEQMHAILKQKGGNPPPLDEKLTGKIDKPSKNHLG